MTTDVADVLLVTTRADAASDAVATALSEKGIHFFRINTEDLPLNARASVMLGDHAANVRWSTAEASASLVDVKRAWFRRHRLPMLDGTQAEIEYCLREAEWFLRGTLFALSEYVPDAAWLNHPIDVWRAESKLYQLTVARRSGLTIPPTLVSNDPYAIRQFFTDHDGQVVAKPLRLGYFDYGDVQKAAFTTLLSAEDLRDAQALVAAPVIYQRFIPKVADVRVTVIDSTIFAAEIDSQSVPAASVDWRRTDRDLRHSIHTLPPLVDDGCRELMLRLNLRFGALDFALDRDGTYQFLEVNPSGQWLWLEDKLGFRISESIASWLAGE